MIPGDPGMTFSSRRLLVLALLLVSVGLLIPGLLAPVLTIRGVLTRDGIAKVAPMMLERGVTDETIAVLKAMMNPTIVALMEARGMDLRKMVIDKISPQLTAALQKSAGDVPVYEQTRSILGSVRRLYEVGSPVPATLILLFSVIVPFGKAVLVGWAMFLTQRAPSSTNAGVRRSDREMVDGRRVRRGAVHCVSGGAGQPDRESSVGPAAHRLHRALRRRLLLVRRVLRVLARIPAGDRPVDAVDGAGDPRLIRDG